MIRSSLHFNFLKVFATTIKRIHLRLQQIPVGGLVVIRSRATSHPNTPGHCYMPWTTENDDKMMDLLSIEIVFRLAHTRSHGRNEGHLKRKNR